jgi:hypothetical protein
VSNDPLTRVDPLGTYETEVHYYLTYFLALTAGLPQQQAMVIATATEYIDHNPLTKPLKIGNSEARRRYHFTQTSSDDLTQVTNTRFVLSNAPGGWNQQLRLLHIAAISDQNTPCAKAQLYGEFLHAFEDTFSHRNENNVPFSPEPGHLFEGTDPDQTYNVDNPITADYQFNELRTLEMEREVFAGLQRDFGRFATHTPSGFPIEWADIAGNGTVNGNGILQRFNQERSDQAKIDILQQALNDFGLPQMQRWEDGLENTADQMRINNLRGLNQNHADYAGVMFPP